MGKIKKIVSMRSGDAYLNYLRDLGCKIGEGTHLYSNPLNIFIDPSRPYLVDIGKNVVITRGVTILTHGFDWEVLKNVYGEILGSAGKVKIGNNVFIGMQTTILKGVTIGDNVIIGANSLINKDIPNDCVVAGNPARIIMTLDEYYERRKDRQVVEAEELIREYRKVYGTEPEENNLHEFFWLFKDSNDTVTKLNDEMLHIGGEKSYQKSMAKFHENIKKFASLKKLLESVD